jgi:hypothetical protein
VPDYRKNKDLKLLDLVKLQQQLDSSEIYEDEDGNKLQTVYLGDIRSITPSGKVYTPFAHSNVKPCERCKGEGTIKNKRGKKHNYKRAIKRDLQLTEQAINKHGCYMYWSTNALRKVEKYRKQQEHWQQYKTCVECGGLGSLEARLDQDFWEQLEMELDEIEAYSHGSESDGCDVMVSRSVD